MTIIRGISLTLITCAAAIAQSGVDLPAMDTTVNACQNFYQYACGGWRNNNTIPPDQARWGRFNQLLDQNQKIERDILEKAAAPSASRTPVEQKIGDYYASCMDEKTIDASGVSGIKAALDQIGKIANKRDLAPEIARLQGYGVRGFFNFGIRPDVKNAKEQIAGVDQGGLTLPDRDYYLKEDPRSAELRKKYLDHVQTMFEQLAKAQGKSDADAGARAEAVMKIETALARASMDRVARRNPDNTYHKMTPDQLAALSPEFGWKRYLADVGIPPVQTLNVGNPDFMKALNTTIASTSLSDLKTYLEWQLVNGNANVLPKPFRDADFDFSQKTLQGVLQAPPRWKQCATATDRSLGEALGQRFIEIAFSPASKTKTLQLVGEIEKEMGRDIQSAAWMSAATRDQALTKLSQVSNKIGYPEHWRDYSSVKVARGDYAGNAQRVREFDIARNFAKLGKPVDKSEWTMTPPTVNAYYSPPENNINFPAGILQPPFYNPKASDAVNYGAIGVVIGHELTHGFDDQGRRFDGEGNLRDWWSPADAKAFEGRADCIANEYSEFSPVAGVKLNGRLTLGENAADNGGIHLAYMALMDSLAGKVLPKKDGFTTEQQFFLGFAQIWCERSSEESARMRAQTDPHSPGEYRVNGVVSNMPEFQQAFSCKVGQPMVSKDPCRVW
jgi:putative endopeptidase